MKAALLTAVGRPLEITDAPLPQLGPNDALVETRTCGICRTDLHIQDGLAYVPKLPHIPGHEPAGVVVEVGRDVRQVRVGQRVVPHLFVRSAECEYTRAGHDAQATHLVGILGVTLPGGFAEYFAAPAENLLELPAEVPFDVGGLTSCAVVTAVHAFHVAGVRPGDTAVVLGAGGIGQILVQILKSRGIRTAAISRSPASRELALASGAEMAIALDEPELPARLRQFVGHETDGVTCVFELVGLAKTMQLAAQIVRRQGKIIVIGEEAEYPAIDTIRIAQRELAIVGSRNGTRQDAREALDMLAAGQVRPPIAARFPLDQINEALAVVRLGQVSGRVLVDINNDLRSGPANTASGR